MAGVSRSSIAFVWDNFGPLHADRADAVALEMSEANVIGIELSQTSRDYAWNSEAGNHFSKITLGSASTSRATVGFRLLRALVKERPSSVFFCHYERPEIFISAILCRLIGIHTFTMNDSKFDDYERHMWREVLKRVFLLPYSGALVASRRSADYLRFLGFSRRKVALGYDAVSRSRIRMLAEIDSDHEEVDFADRHFTIVARLIPKKNIELAIDAFALARRNGVDRNLIICGSGPLDIALRNQVMAHNIDEYVTFKGFVQSHEVAKALSTSLALILCSKEEQFGQAIAESIVMDVPVIVSENCGARDELVRNGINGFVIEPDNDVGLSRFMTDISEDEALWRSLSEGCADFAAKADLPQFVHGVVSLLESKRRRVGKDL